MNSLSKLSQIKVTVTGARGAAGVEYDTPPTPGQFLVKAAGGGRKYVGVSGATPVNAVALTDLSSPTGSQLVGFRAIAPGAMARTTQDKARETVSVKDFGAIGDGASHPVSQWLTGGLYAAGIGPTGNGFINLAAIQAVYPDVRSLTDEIDFAAMNKAVRVMIGNGGGEVRFPAGTYLGWLYVRGDNVALRGAGSICARIRVPAGAQHSQPNEAGTGTITGTPTVIDAGNLSRGNNAPAYSGLVIEGLTLDGNAANTTAPAAPNDVNGWGLTFTRFSNVRYYDLVAINCHLGGVGTFINSNYHSGECTVESCGFAQSTPGFDVNSSKHGDWRVTSKTCAVGCRLLDNGWDNSLSGVIENAGTYGLLFDNQPNAPQNASDTTTVNLTIRGGCTIAGAQIGAKASNSTLTLTVFATLGIGVRQVKQSAADRDSRGLIVTARVQGCQLAGVVIGGRLGQWNIGATGNGLMGSTGDYFQVEVEGSHNTLIVTTSDNDPPKSRGVAFRTGANANRLLSYVYDNTVQALLDQGAGNRTVGGLPDSGWAAATGTASKGAFASAAADTASVTYVQAEAQADKMRIAAMEAQLVAIRQVIAAAGLTNA